MKRGWYSTKTVWCHALVFLLHGNTIMSSLTAVNDRENQEIVAKNVVIFLTCVQRGMVFLSTSQHNVCFCFFFLRTLMTPNIVGERSNSHASVLRIVSIHRNTLCGFPGWSWQFLCTDVSQINKKRTAFFRPLRCS